MKARFVEQAAEMWKSELSEESMIFSLKDAGADPDEIADIMAVGHAEYVAKRKVINKTCYFIALGLLVVTFIVFIAVLPGTNMVVGQRSLYSIFGALLITFFAFHVVAYRNTWKSPFVETHGKPRIQYVFFLFF